MALKEKGYHVYRDPWGERMIKTRRPAWACRFEPPLPRWLRKLGHRMLRGRTRAENSSEHRAYERFVKGEIYYRWY